MVPATELRDPGPGGGPGRFAEALACSQSHGRQRRNPWTTFSCPRKLPSETTAGSFQIFSAFYLWRQTIGQLPVSSAPEEASICNVTPDSRDPSMVRQPDPGRSSTWDPRPRLQKKSLRSERPGQEHSATRFKGATNAIQSRGFRSESVEDRARSATTLTARRTERKGKAVVRGEVGAPRPSCPRSTGRILPEAPQAWSFVLAPRIQEPSPWKRRSFLGDVPPFVLRR